MSASTAATLGAMTRPLLALSRGLAIGQPTVRRALLRGRVWRRPDRLQLATWWPGGYKDGPAAGNFVFGIEADIQGADITGSGTSIGTGALHGEDNLDWFGTVRGRVGYAVGAALLYGTGGVAFGGVQDKLTVVGATKSHDATDTGYAAGGGVEYAFAPSWSGKVEYQYINLGNDTVTNGARHRDVRSRVQHRPPRLELSRSSGLRASEVGFFDTASKAAPPGAVFVSAAGGDAAKALVGAISCQVPESRALPLPAPPRREPRAQWRADPHGLPRHREVPRRRHLPWSPS